MRSILPSPPPFCQQGIWRVEKVSALSKAKELIKAELGSERRHLGPKHRLLPPHHKGLFHISTASSGSLAEEQEERKTLPGGREATAQHPCGCWWEREKPCPLVSLFHAEAPMPNATQMEVCMEAVPHPTTDRRLWSIRPQATQATKTQPKAEQTQTLSPPEAAVFPSVCPRGVGQGWGRMGGAGSCGASGRGNGSVPGGSCTAARETARRWGRTYSLNLTDFSLGSLLVFKSLLYFGFIYTSYEFKTTEFELRMGAQISSWISRWIETVFKDKGF